MKKFFVFLIINYIIIHIAAFPQLANDIVNTGWGESGNFCLENVFFCNPIWRGIVAVWRIPFYSIHGPLNYFLTWLEWYIINVCIILFSFFFFFCNWSKRYVILFIIYVLTCFFIIPIPREFIEQYPWLQFLKF